MYGKGDLDITTLEQWGQKDQTTPKIGNHVAVAAGTQIITHDGAIWCFRDEIEYADIFGKIKIGNNVFIGNNCTILPNTIIGDNCIIGAGSVVRGKFAENSVIVGNPAKVVLKMSFQKFLYLQNPGLLRTQNLTDFQKSKIIKKHFGIQLWNSSLQPV